MDSRYLEKTVSSSCASTTVTRNYSSCSSNWCWRKNRRNIAVRESNGKRWVWPSKTHTVITWRNSTWLWWYSTRTFWLDISSDFAHCGWLEEYHQFLTVRILHIVLILIICFTLFPMTGRLFQQQNHLWPDWTKSQGNICYHGWGLLERWKDHRPGKTCWPLARALFLLFAPTGNSTDTGTFSRVLACVHQISNRPS